VSVTFVSYKPIHNPKIANSLLSPSQKNKNTVNRKQGNIALKGGQSKQAFGKMAVYYFA